MNKFRRDWILLCLWFKGLFTPSFKRKLRKIEKENNLKDWARVGSKDDGTSYFIGKARYKLSKLNNRRVTAKVIPTDYMVYFRNRWRRVYSTKTTPTPTWFIVWEKDKVSITKKNFKDFKE